MPPACPGTARCSTSTVCARRTSPTPPASSHRCPVLNKSNTFDRFPLHELAPRVSMSELASVLTSSGHGGRFSFGLTTRKDAGESASVIDYALDRAFAVESRPTLAINCLPMGVTFSSRAMTVATVSVREDMAVALVRAFGGYYEQILLVMDPLFAKRLTDYAAAEGLDWSRYRIQVVIGEEVFGEHFREYLGSVPRPASRSAGGRLRHVVIRGRRARPAPVLRNAGDDRAAARDTQRRGAGPRSPRRLARRGRGAGDPELRATPDLHRKRRSRSARLRAADGLDARYRAAGVAAPLSDRRHRQDPRARCRGRGAAESRRRCERGCRRICWRCRGGRRSAFRTARTSRSTRMRCTPIRRLPGR